ncbi:SIMPL domain-containing protein [Halomonas sp. Bachu 37]|uniref:SIMPL domain-containing protein n=1 Tax=Halomonas kashgarensis TaxID=3084920 RepID=UPI003217C160
MISFTTRALRSSMLASAAASLLATGLLVSAPSAMASNAPPPSLSIQAQASVEVEPDKATLNARLWERTPAIAQHEDQQQDSSALAEARERLEERTGNLIRQMEDAGLARDAINAGSLNIQPEHISGPRNADEERKTLVRTRLERPVEVELNDLDQLGEILDALVSAGVNSLDGVQFDLQDREAATDEALVKALEKARHKAELMAKTLDITLGEITQVQETQSPIFSPRMMSMRADSAESAGGQSEYRPGTISIDAGVNVQWSLTAEGAPRPSDRDATAQEQ